MPLVNVPADEFVVDMLYATPHNFIGRAIYHQPRCLLHHDALAALNKSSLLARSLGYRIKITDAFRPLEAQFIFWNACPDPDYVSHPVTGERTHCRGIAVDLTLVDVRGKELDMGTPIDDFTPASHHGSQIISPEAQSNRLILLGIMTLAGWNYLATEWWHYQLPNLHSYPILEDKNVRSGIITEE